VTAPDDAQQVMSALRLGWYLAEVRGRNRPDGPPGSSARMPDHLDHPLPLRNERSPTDIRIEAQFVVKALAKALYVDDAGPGVSFGEAIDNQAKLLAHVRAPTASRAMQQCINALAESRSSEVVELLQQALTAQQDVVAMRQQAVTDAERALADAEPEHAERAQAAVQLERATAECERTGLVILQNSITALQPATTRQSNPATAGQTDPPAAELANPEQAQPATTEPPALAVLQTGLQNITDAVHQAWEDLATLLWRFDAHIQDELTATAESLSVGYQLGRGLAETYWALDPIQETGSTGWSFLLGQDRCAELSRLLGRLGAYMGPYTAPAVAGTIVIWQSVACKPDWRGAPLAAQQALFLQSRRWYELIVLAQDPTTLIEPYRLVTNHRTAIRAFRLFWPQLAATVFGVGFLVTLLVLLSGNSRATLEKTLSGVLAGIGLSIAGLTGRLKTSAQAMLTRLRQDSYTDLVILAVQTAPPPKKKALLQQALDQRTLTPATPN
jgi:hypothetical protein